MTVVGEALSMRITHGFTSRHKATATLVFRCQVPMQMKCPILISMSGDLYKILEGACDFTRLNQPIRSTWAAIQPFDGTGLADIHPFLNYPVNDVCEDAGGDGYVSTIPVLEGEYYFILINDYSGIIFSGAMSADFSATTFGVLGAHDQFMVHGDTVLCEGESTEIFASGGEIYEWLPAQSLSCDDCPNPVAEPNGYYDLPGQYTRPLRDVYRFCYGGGLWC